ncbi:DMT family transporter [Parafrigoribacterium soli]|uniref:DMT family transporter n=1 Tax=Parafrigoribacterium soli TaxID=3144663 RepID=UPI0032EEC6E9
MLLPVIIGLSGALIFGAADFLGGMAAKRISAVRVTAIGAASGVVLLCAAYVFIGGTWSREAVLLGALSGVTGAIAIVLLYACLAIGPMSILSPTTAVVSALVPMLVGVVRGDRLNTIGYVALGLALVAVILVGFVPEKGAVRPSLKALGMAVGSGAMIGAFIVIIDMTPPDSGVVPLIANRAVNGLIVWTAIGVMVLLAKRRGRATGVTPTDSRGWRPGLTLAIVSGVIDATANVFLLIGLRVGELTIQSVLTALYPAGTIILAAVVLKERIAPVQIVGLVLAITAASMLALA